MSETLSIFAISGLVLCFCALVYVAARELSNGWREDIPALDETELTD